MSGASQRSFCLPPDLGQGDLPGVHFLSRELFSEIRDRVFEHFSKDADRLGYGEMLKSA